jgi:hypothetical protein
MNIDMAGQILVYCLLAIPIVFAIGLIKGALNDESVHSEDFSSKLEDSHQDKAA